MLILSAVLLGSSVQKWVGVVYRDSAGYGDNAHLVQTINGKGDRLTHVVDNLYSDRGADPFFIPTGRIKLKSRYIVNHELPFIDLNVFRYRLGVQNLSDGFTLPENLNLNISGNVLDLFSAHTSQFKVVIHSQVVISFFILIHKMNEM
jgi:hypothetical protein